MEIFLLREEEDPFAVFDPTTAPSGVINIIDLVNLYSCSFIATEDVGKLSSNGDFQILGRRDHSDIRGCSLMVV